MFIHTLIFNNENAPKIPNQILRNDLLYQGFKQLVRRKKEAKVVCARVQYALFLKVAF